jgi:hypothetical protein
VKAHLDNEDVSLAVTYIGGSFDAMVEAAKLDLNLRESDLRVRFGVIRDY